MNEDLIFECASLREFAPHEKHVKRVCESDVLVMVLDGVLRFNEDGEDKEVFPGEYYIQHFGAIHGECEESDSPQYLYIHFRGSWGEGRSFLPFKGSFSMEDIRGDIEKLNSLVYGNGSKTEILSLFYGIFSFLFNGKNHTETTAEKILKTLTHDLKSPPSLDELANICHFSKNYVINLVKKEFSMTPYEYLKRERVKYSARLMGSTSKSLDYIAEESGFGDYSVFFRSFKSVYGISPSEWCEKMKK